MTHERHGIAVAGGKGRASREALSEIETASHRMGVSSSKIGELQYASKMCAKVDTSAVQSGYPIYHHAFFLTENGNWAVVQQGLDLSDRTARRYHWTSERIQSFVEEPHNAIVGDSARKHVLNMTASDSEESRKTSVDLVRGNPNNLISSIRSVSSTPTMDRWTINESTPIDPRQQFQAYEMPSRLNWNIFFDLYDVQPRNFEEIIALRGVGPSAVRALALVAQLIYGSSPSWKDPVKFSFAHGGKDGVPFPVNRKAMESSTRFIRQMLESCEADRQLKRDAFVRLVRVERSWSV